MNAKVKEGRKAEDGTTDTLPDSAAGNAAASTGGEKATANMAQLKSDNVSKEDLLEILQKMNRKVKALSTIRQQLTEKVEAAESDKARLKALVVDEILNGVQLQEGQDEVIQLQAAWRQVDEQNALNLQQLQSEFQVLRMEQQASSAADGGTSNSDWTQEKNQILAKHKAEMDQLKQDLTEQHARDMQALKDSQPTSADVGATSSNEEEIKRVKAAAAAQLQAFRKKFAAAHTTEMEKVKAQLVEAAKKQLDKRLSEQKAQHEEELLKLREDYNKKSQSLIEEQKKIWEQQSQHHNNEAESDLVDKLKKEHAAEIQRMTEQASSERAAEIENARQQVEQTVTTEMEEKLQELLGEMRRKHQEEVESLKAEASRELTEATNKTTRQVEAAKEASEKAAKLEKEIEAIKTEHENALQALKDELDAVTVTRRDEASSGSEKDAEIERLGALVMEANKENEDLRAAMELKLKESQNMLLAAEASHNSNLQSLKDKYASDLSARLEEVERKHAEALEKVKSHSEVSFQQQLQESQKVAAAKKETFEKEVQSQLHAIQTQLQEKNEVVKKLQETERNLSAELEEVQSKLRTMTDERAAMQAAAVDGEKSSNQMMQEALAQQRSSYEESIENLKQRFEQEKSAKNDEMERLVAGLEKARSELDSITSKLENSNMELSSVEAKYGSEMAQLRQQVQDYQKLLSDKQVELDAATSKLTEVSAAVEEKSELIANQKTELEKRLESVMRKGDEDIQKLNTMYEDKLKLAMEREKELTEKLGAMDTSLDSKISNVKRELQNEIDRLLSENSALSSAIEEQKNIVDSHRKAEVELKRDLESKSGLAAELKRQADELSEKLKAERLALQSLKDETNAKVSSLEEKLVSGQKELNEALASADSSGDLAKKLNELAESHAAEIAKLKEDHAKALQQAREQIQTDRHDLDIEIEQRVKAAKDEAAKELESALQSHNVEKEEMRKKMESHVDNMNARFKAKLEETRQEASSELEKLKQSDKEKGEKIIQLVDRLKALTAGTSNLRNANEEMKLKLESESKIQQALRAQIESIRKEMDEAVTTSSSTAASLLQQQEALEKEKGALNNQMAQLRGERDAAKNKVEELAGKLGALTSNLNAMAEERDAYEQKLQAAAKYEAKLTTSEKEVTDLREKVNKLKLELTQNSSLVSRLEAEKEANERSQGERTALVGMLETQLSEMNDKNADINAKLEAALYDLSQKDEAIQTSQEHINKLEAELKEARNAAKRASEAAASAHKGAEAKSSKTVESLQKELQAVKQQMVKKSSAAQRLLQEREAECAELRKTNSKLQQEVDKGSLSDRKIFELAAKQSNRESQQVSEITARDKAIETMKKALVERDIQLATAEKRVEDVQSQVDELCRIRRREDVNLDYLKSIVVQYLSLPPGSSERAGLLPVLATLLQFNSQDYQTIEEGKKKLSWWGSVTPTLINPPTAPSSSSTGSAEVSISKNSASGGQGDNQPRTTSLQF